MAGGLRALEMREISPIMKYGASRQGSFPKISKF